MKTRLALPARQQAQKMNAWWRHHRPDAKKLFAEELREARKRLAEKPNIGQIFAEREGMVVRRLLLEKTRNHVYYEVHENEGVVMIVALWGAVKGTGPDLGSDG